MNPASVTNAGGESSHGPPPSLWPVGFAVGIVCILVGLVVSWPAVAVGAALTLVFGFLWIRDVSRGYSTVPGPEAEAEGAPEPAPALPAHKGPEEGTREWPDEIRMTDEVRALVDRRWREYGL